MLRSPVGAGSIRMTLLGTLNSYNISLLKNLTKFYNPKKLTEELKMINKTKLSLICLLVLFIIFSSMTFAQEKAKKSGGGRGYFMIGWSMLDIDKLNAQLSSKGYTEFSNNFISIGGGGHGIVNKLIMVVRAARLSAEKRL